MKQLTGLLRKAPEGYIPIHWRQDWGNYFYEIVGISDGQLVKRPLQPQRVNGITVFPPEAFKRGQIYYRVTARKNQDGKTRFDPISGYYIFEGQAPGRLVFRPISYSTAKKILRRRTSPEEKALSLLRKALKMVENDWDRFNEVLEKLREEKQW